jgi:thymidylate kinase
MRWERLLYRNMPPPDIVLRLDAPVEVAVSRDATRCKAGGPDSAAVQRRWKMESIGEHPSAHVVVVDTTGPVEDTIRLAVAAIWKAL